MLVILLGLKLVKNLVHGILAGAVGRIILMHEPVAKVFLQSAHRHRTGIHHALDATQPGGLEAVVHAQNVELHSEMGLVFATPEEIGQIEDARWSGLERDTHDILKLRHITSDDLHLIAQVSERGSAGIDIHTHHVFTARHQPTNGPRTDKTRPSKYQYGHGAFLLLQSVATHLWCKAPDN